MWKKLSKREKEKICDSDTQKICLLDKLIEEYDLIDYNFFRSGCPIMYALTYGNYRLSYRNIYGNINKMKIYGFQNPNIFSHPLIDHCLCFRNRIRKCS